MRLLFTLNTFFTSDLQLIWSLSSEDELNEHRWSSTW